MKLDPRAFLTKNKPLDMIHLFSVTLSFLLITGLSACKPRDPEKVKAEAITQALATADNSLTAGNTSAARETLTILLAQYPDATNVLEALALLESQANNPGEAARLFAQLAEQTPEDASYLRYAAGEATKAGLCADAADYYTRYLTHEPEDAAAWEALGTINQARGDTLQALAAYQRALSLDKDKTNSPLIINCLTLSLERQDIPLAEVYLEALRRQQGINSIEVQLGLFDLSCIKGAHAHAQAALTWLEAHAPETLADASRKASITTTQAWQSTEASRIAALEAEAQRIQLAGLAQIQAEAAATEQARLIAEETAIAAAEAAALNPPALTDAAQAKADEGDYAAATTLYWKALALDSSSAETWQSLSQSALKNGALEQAEMAALEAQRRDNTNLLYTLNLLDIMQQSATPERLLEELVRAKETFPQSIELTYDLAHGYETLGHNPRNAKILYEDYLNIAPADHLHREAAEAALLRLNRGG